MLACDAPLALPVAGATEARSPVAPTAAKQQRLSSTSPAVLALLRLAKAQAQSGLGEQAAATLERALVIEPRNPWLWHRLAVLKLQLGQTRQAVHLAQRSNALAAGHRRLLGGNWELIARALDGRGDKKAALARIRARAYRLDTPKSEASPGWVLQDRRSKSREFRPQASDDRSKTLR